MALEIWRETRDRRNMVGKPRAGNTMAEEIGRETQWPKKSGRNRMAREIMWEISEHEKLHGNHAT